MKFAIGKRKIGEGEPTFIILEIARTYNSMKTAEKMIRIAAECGADAVKIQSIQAEKLLVREKHTENHYKILESLERSFEEHKHLADFSKGCGIEFLSTPESLEMVDLLERVGVKAYKIASLDIVYYDLLRYSASKGKPMLVSTGMADTNEIKKAWNIIGSTGNKKVCFMHCSSLYPPRAEDTNLRAVQTINNLFKYLPVGYSDHTIGINAPIISVALGANVLEKHFTLDRKQKGADHKVAVNPEMLDKMIKGVREVEKMLGDGFKKPSKKEEMVKRVKRRKLVAAKDMNSGRILKKTDIECKQTDTPEGLESKYINNVIGRKLIKNLKKNNIITFDMLGD